VKSSDEEMALLDQGGEAVAASEDFDVGTYAGDAWRTDEYHFQWTAGKFSGSGKDSGVNLTAIGVAFDGSVKDAEASLRRVQHFAR